MSTSIHLKIRSKALRISERNSFYRNIYLLAHKVKKARMSRLDDIAFAKLYYRDKTGNELNLEDPQTFDEKLWYLKLYNRDPLLTICSDKYRVREYVEQCGLKDILIEQYGVYDSAEEVDFGHLPSPCFLKCNHASGANVIYDRNRLFDQKTFCKKFNASLHSNYYAESREWNYKDIPPKIIAEKVLQDKNGNLPFDYKFMCFHGIPRIMYLSIDTCKEDGTHAGSMQKLNYYDMDFKLLDIVGAGLKNIDVAVECPATFEKMKEYAAILSKPFPFCRVDFYSVDNRIYFGELTFYPTGGCQNLQPREWSLLLGSWIDISKVPKVNKACRA